MIEEATICCPYCGEYFVTLVDYSAGTQSYIEDCYVCCRPVVFTLHVSAGGELMDIVVATENE